MGIASRKVIHMHETDHTVLEWTKQQIRNACFEDQPKFLLHDNDGKFGQLRRPLRVENARKRVSCRSACDEWLWQEMGIRGIAIPYGASNAAAHIERLIGALRRLCSVFRYVLSLKGKKIGFSLFLRCFLFPC